MAISVFIQPTLNNSLSQGIPVFSFEEDEGEYWFLHPLFEKLAFQTGQYIDLYGDAVFGGDDLHALEEIIVAASGLTEAQSDEWKVVTAIELGRPPKEVWVSLNKPKMLSFLDKIQSAIDEARQKNHSVVFRGD